MVLIFLLINIFLILLFSSSANAYIDPNTGGFFFQTVAPFVYAILGAIVIFWKRITIFVKGLFSRGKEKDKSVNNE
ncbi:MAG: hypothetical protein Fur0020_13920 [Thermodesulfovibrionia bacterium]